MAIDDQHRAGDPAADLSEVAHAEEVLFQASLLAGLGAAARPLAGRVAAVLGEHRGGRTCLDGGTPLQFTATAPGAPFEYGFRAAPRCDQRVAAMPGVLSAADAEALGSFTDRLAPPTRAPPANIGSWVFSSAESGESTLWLDIRDGSPRAAWRRACAAVGVDGRHEAWLDRATPWSLSLGVRRGTLVRAELHWLLQRHLDPAPQATGVAGAQAWSQARDLLDPLLGGVSAHHGPWVVATPLLGAGDGELEVASSGWARVADGEAKRARLLEAIASGGGDRHTVDALWSLLRGHVPIESRWRIGRALSVRVRADAKPMLRAHLVPWSPALLSPRDASQ